MQQQTFADVSFEQYRKPNRLERFLDEMGHDLGIAQDVYRYDEGGGRCTQVLPTLPPDLTEFAESWFANLKDQGFSASTVVREILSPCSGRAIQGA